ncbi:MAG: GNAT family N-acetyltransferase, partial [Trueperaceae bacterium]
MPLRIRPVRATDYPDVARLSERIDPEAARTEAELREADLRRDARMMFGGMIAEVDGECAAFAIYKQYPRLYEPDKVVLSGGVEAEHRRSGVGRALLRSLEEQLWAAGVRRLQGTARPADRPIELTLRRSSGESLHVGDLRGRPTLLFVFA